MPYGQAVFAVVPALREVVQRLAAGIGQAQHARRLVEALAGGVVARGAEDAHVRVPAHVHQHRVAAGDGQAEEGRLQLGEGEVVGGDVPADVVHGHQRHVHRQGGGLGEVHAHQQRADQPRRIGHGHGADVPARDAGGGERPLRQVADDLRVAAGGDLRHHAAVDGVQVGLGEYLVCEHLAPVAHQGHGGLVAGGLHGKYDHVRPSFRKSVMITASSAGCW